MNQLVKGKLKKTDFSTLTPSKFDESKKQTIKKKVVVFIVGGVTYQENRELQLAGVKNNFECIVGSNTILNSSKFIAQLEKLHTSKKDSHEDESDKLIKKMA